MKFLWGVAVENGCTKIAKCLTWSPVQVQQMTFDQNVVRNKHGYCGLLYNFQEQLCCKVAASSPEFTVSCGECFARILIPSISSFHSRIQ